MPKDRACPECGRPLPEGALEGVCPFCSLASALKDIPASLFEAQALRDGSHSSTLASRTVARFGDYELLELLARGGMGVVYKARQISLNRTVALKMIQTGELASAAEVKRFRAEAEAIGRLQHPNIVAIHEFGEHDGQHYFSMDYVSGRTLAEIVREGPLPARRAAAYVRTVAAAVHYAHEQGIIHRDLKPGNVIIDEHDQPRITDFGLAKRLTDSQLSTPNPAYLTLSGQVLGSPNYLPPEQTDAKRGTVGPWSDVYGLGAILYHLVTGRPPFQADSLTTLLRQVIETDPVAPRLLNPGIPRDLETICLKCLEKETHRRYATARALASDLERFLNQEPVLARPIHAPAKAWRWCRRRPARAGLAGALVLVFALGLTGVLWELDVAEDARRVAEKSRHVAEAASSNLVEKLWAANLAEARANRWSGRAGRRFASLEAIQEAAAIRPTLELRSEAIACLTLADVRVLRTFSSEVTRSALALAFDENFKRYACWSGGSTVKILPVDLSAPGALTYADGYAAEVLTNSSLLGTTTTLLFSSRGRFLAQCSIGQSNTTHTVWDRSDGRVWVLPDVRDIRFTPDEEQLVTAERDGRIRLYDLESGKELGSFQVAPGVAGLAFDPAGKRLAVSRAGNPGVVVLDFQSKSTCATLTNAGNIGGVAWSPDGKVLACLSSDTRVYLWNVATGERKALQGHTSPAVMVMFNHLGDMLVSQAWDGTTRFWDAKLGLPLVSILGHYLHNGFDPSDRLLGFGMWSAGQFGIWEVEPARECRRLGQTTRLWDAAFSDDGRVLATASDDGTRLWEVESNLMLAHLPMYGARSVAWGPGGTNLIVCGWQGLRCWPIERSSGLDRMRIGTVRVLSSVGREQARLTPDGNWVVSAGPQGGDVLVMNLQEPESARLWSGHVRAAFVSVSPDGKWFATGTWKGQNVKVWSMESCRPVKELPVVSSARCTFSADNRWLVTGGTEEYAFWKVDTWERALTVPRERVADIYGAMSISDDGRMAALLVGRNRGVKLISLPDGQELATLDTGEPLCFSRDGNRLATTGEDRQTLLVWDLQLIRRQLRALGLDWN